MSKHPIERRRFLQAMGAVGGAAALPIWMTDMASAATPIADDQGILVYIMMNGGNDPLNTLIPIQDQVYYDSRPTLGIRAQDSLPLTSTRHLHPSLPTLKSLYDRGDVAFIEGIGVDDGNLSHFDTMARVQSGRGAPGGNKTGWLGRYIDGLPGGDDNFHGVTLGYDTPLSVQGVNRQATALPNKIPDAVRVSGVEAYTLRRLDTLKQMGGGGYGLGRLGDELGQVNADALNVAGQLENLFSSDESEYDLVPQIQMVARLINANLGIRVFALDFGSFDTHSEQEQRHAAGLNEFDAALSAFYEILSDSFASRTMIYTMSEFGRRLDENGSLGTDHGSAGLSMAIGKNVKGGMYGSMPSLTNLDNSGNLVPTTNYLDAYGTILTTWLGANSESIIGQNTSDLGFLSAPLAGVKAPPVLAATEQTQYRRDYDSVIRLYLAYFSRLPDKGGLDYWLGLVLGGGTLTTVSDSFAGSAEFSQTYGRLDNRGFVRLIYRNVLGRSPDRGGEDYWTALLDANTSRGTVMLGFSESPEFTETTRVERDHFDIVGPVGRLYRAYFLRAPDPAGLDYWISTGFAKQSISDEFSRSEEFVGRYGSLNNNEFANLIYANVLDRSPDRSGLDYWTARLDSGLSRGEVMLGFSDSPEFVTKVLAMS